MDGQEHGRKPFILPLQSKEISIPACGNLSLFGAATLNVAGIFRLSIRTVPQLPKPKVSRLAEGRAGKSCYVYISVL